jgi:hypothetical protein
MTTQGFGDLERRATDDERPSGIPRSGSFGTATSELLWALVALAALVLIGCSFYFGSK